MEFGPLRILADEFIATLIGETLALSYKEFRLLVLLARNAGRVVRRETIASEIWGGSPAWSNHGRTYGPSPGTSSAGFDSDGDTCWIPLPARSGGS